MCFRLFSISMQKENFDELGPSNLFKGPDIRLRSEIYSSFYDYKPIFQIWFSFEMNKYYSFVNRVFVTSRSWRQLELFYRLLSVQ